MQTSAHLFYDRKKEKHFAQNKFKVNDGLQ